MFFEFAQTNYFYIDEESLRQRLDQFYSCPNQSKVGDAPWVSVVLMVFALGVQYSKGYQSSARDSCKKLMGDAHDICQSLGGSTISSLYQGVTKLIPSILASRSVESVQAFLLLGLYMLPVDPAGLSCTYFGIAIKLATQLSMHRKISTDLSERDLEVRKRVWWTTYAHERCVQTLKIIRHLLTFRRRICILYGRPVSISRADITLDLPVDMEELQPKERINTFQNNAAMLQLTISMEDARDGMLVHPTPFSKLTD